jgi:Mg/Co/Ni transporter MgtE
MGIGFAFVYSAFLSLSSLPFNALTGLLLGSIHGVIAMLLVSILIMEHHPEPRYHDRGPSTGLAQLGAHMLYGTVVGSVVALLR